MGNGDLRGHHPQNPIWVEGIDTMGCRLVPQGDHSQHWLVYTPLPCSPWHNFSWLRWTIILFAIFPEITPLCIVDAKVGLWKEINEFIAVLLYNVQNFIFGKQTKGIQFLFLKLNCWQN
jgi:hypothetical protein